MTAGSPLFLESIPVVAFTTLGCPKNEVDTDLMRRAVEQAGYRSSEYFAEKPGQAAAIVVNTCSFIQEATEASIEAIFDALEVSPSSVDRPVVIVAGCIVNRYADDLASEMPEVEAFIKVGDTDALVRVLRDCLAPGSPVPLERAAGQPRTYEYLRIADGCDRKCTFCTIPSIRGPYVSRTPEDILGQAQTFIAAGTRELIVIAQDIGRYGSDLQGGDGNTVEPNAKLVKLLEQLASLPGLKRLRLMYLQPEGLTDDLIATMARNPQIVPYLEVPLQHVSPRILKAMGRNPRDVANFTTQLGRARTLIPELAVRTTLIAGFPGETEEEFTQLCDFVEACAFDYVGVFPYSPEEGTRAAKLPGQIDEATRLKRAQTLRDLSDSIAWSKMAQRAGQTVEVLVEGCDDGEDVLIARASFQAPDIDGIVRVSPPAAGSAQEAATAAFFAAHQANTYLEVEFTDAILYDMDARIIAIEGERDEV